MRFGSVCSGIEAASAAWTLLGWSAAWFSEIEPFPSAVLAHHYPDVPNLGDMTTLPERIRGGEVEAPDLFCGGTPCQAFSVAGLRKSLADARGNLSLTFCEIADAIDDVRHAGGKPPAVIFWENVPGVLSTDDNAFGCFLGAIAGCDSAINPRGIGWTDAGVVDGPRRAVAWRILDAQFFGLAQRRRRVFVVASAREGFDPATVLLEFDGVRRDSAPRREAGKSVARNAAASVDCVDFQNSALSADICGTLDAEGQTRGNRGHGVLAFDTYNQAVNAHTSQTIKSPQGAVQAHAFDARQSDVIQYGDKTGPLDTDGHSVGALAFSSKDYGGDASVDVAPTVAWAIGSHAGAADGDQTNRGHAAGGPVGSNISKECAYSLRGGRTQNVGTATQVRRLTPRECERLQGFPDDYTLIPWRGKPADQCPDGPRYKALGNSWAVPVVRWIGARIADRISRENT